MEAFMEWNQRMRKAFCRNEMNVKETPTQVELKQKEKGEAFNGST